MTQIIKVDIDNPHLLALIASLDNELNEIYGEGMKDYNPYNTLATISVALVLCEDGRPVGCGCFKKFDERTIEVKRMFVLKTKRGQGYSKQILSRLESAAFNQGFRVAILETGNLQHAAMRVYESMGYERIPNYGQYANLPSSICYKKILKSTE